MPEKSQTAESRILSTCPKSMQLNIQNAQESIQQQLAAISETAALDAQVLLAHIMGKPRSWVLAHPETMLSADQMRQIRHTTHRMVSGEPLPYILGHWEFYGLDFTITPAVLIPRPETELLVDQALKWLQKHPGRRHAIDVGSGSGCIAIALATHIPDLSMLAVDISWPALQVARQNLLNHRVANRVTLLQADLLTGIRPLAGQRFDLIAANLPYIPDATLASLDALRYEPQTALSGGSSGMELIQRLLSEVSNVLSPGGLLLLEIEATLGAAISNLVQASLPLSSAELLPDLSGRDRLVLAHS